MSEKQSYWQIAAWNLDKVVKRLQEGNSFSELVKLTPNYAVYWFYLGDIDYARKASLIYSLNEYENEFNEDKMPDFKIYVLFHAALFRDLALHHEEATQIWQQLIDLRRSSFTEADIYQKRLGWRIGCAWVHEAYALTKLGRYAEVAEPARIGHEAIRRGKGTDPTPYMNSREFGLSKLLIETAKYRLSPDDRQKKIAQKTLQAYKENNSKHHRLGYGVIFDLQFTYPDVFTPVLPGSNPEMD